MSLDSPWGPVKCCLHCASSNNIFYHLPGQRPARALISAATSRETVEILLWKRARVNEEWTRVPRSADFLSVWSHFLYGLLEKQLLFCAKLLSMNLMRFPFYFVWMGDGGRISLYGDMDKIWQERAEWSVRGWMKSYLVHFKSLTVKS